MKFECIFSEYISKKNNDHWKIQIVEANSGEEALKKLVEEHNRDGKKINYVLSVEEIKNNNKF